MASAEELLPSPIALFREPDGGWTARCLPHAAARGRDPEDALARLRLVWAAARRRARLLGVPGPRATGPAPAHLWAPPAPGRCAASAGGAAAVGALAAAPAAPRGVPGQTRWAFDGAGIAFRIWARPVVSGGGRAVAPTTLLWRFPDGATGRRGCAGFVEAMEHASRVVVAAGNGERPVS